jgi:hypothetical protein
LGLETKIFGAAGQLVHLRRPVICGSLCCSGLAEAVPGVSLADAVAGLAVQVEGLPAESLGLAGVAGLDVMPPMVFGTYA